MDKQTFENLAPDKKIEFLNKVYKGEEKLDDDFDFSEIFGGLKNNA